MSYYVSNQQLISYKLDLSNYRPVSYAFSGCETEHYYLNSGHPLFFLVCEIVQIKNIFAHTVNYPFIPDGCISMIFSGAAGSGIFDKAYICGTIDEAKKLQLAQSQDYLIIRYRPGFIANILPYNLSAIKNRTLELSKSMDNGDRLLFIAGKELPLNEKILQMSQILARNYMLEYSSEYIIRYCLNKIIQDNGNVFVAQPAKETGFSERYIGKLFERYVGISPKMFAEIIKLQCSLRNILQTESSYSLADIANESGYYDHAHMNHAYHKFLSCSSGKIKEHGLAALEKINMDSVL